MTSEEIAALLAECLDDPRVESRSEVDGSRVWLYVEGSIFRIDVVAVAMSPAREAAA